MEGLESALDNSEVDVEEDIGAKPFPTDEFFSD